MTPRSRRYMRLKKRRKMLAFLNSLPGRGLHPISFECDHPLFAGFTGMYIVDNDNILWGTSVPPKEQHPPKSQKLVESKDFPGCMEISVAFSVKPLSSDRDATPYTF